jgi:hypothetical protein
LRASPPAGRLALVEGRGLEGPPELRYLYPIDWPQVSHRVRSVRAKGRRRAAARMAPWYGTRADGRCWDEQRQAWRDGRGRKVPSPAPAEAAEVRCHD